MILLYELSKLKNHLNKSNAKINIFISALSSIMKILLERYLQNPADFHVLLTVADISLSLFFNKIYSIILILKY